MVKIKNVLLLWLLKRKGLMILNTTNFQCQVIVQTRLKWRIVFHRLGPRSKSLVRSDNLRGERETSTRYPDVEIFLLVGFDENTF